MHIYIHIHIYIANVPSRLLLIHQWPHDNSCTWAHDVRLHIAGTNEPKSAKQVKQAAVRSYFGVVINF